MHFMIHFMTYIITSNTKQEIDLKDTFNPNPILTVLACIMIMYWNLEERNYGQIRNLTIDSMYHENATNIITVNIV